MGMYSTLLVAIFTFLTTSEIFAHSRVLPVVSRDTLNSHQALIIDSKDVNGKRNLRTTKAADDDGTEDSTHSSDINERRGIVASMLRAIGNKISMRWWLETGKSDDYVKEVLGMKGLAGKDLTSHKNYKIFQQFSLKAEGRKFHNWLMEDPPLSTFGAWERLGLEKNGLAEGSDKGHQGNERVQVLRTLCGSLR